MRHWITLSLLILCGCGKGSGNESAALTAGLLCRDVIACSQFCDTKYQSKLKNVSWSNGSGYFTAVCPASVNTSSCGSLSNYPTCLPTLGCTIEPDAASAQAVLDADKAKNCLNLPEVNVTGSHA